MGRAVKRDAGDEDSPRATTASPPSKRRAKPEAAEARASSRRGEVAEAAAPRGRGAGRRRAAAKVEAASPRTKSESPPPPTVRAVAGGDPLSPGPGDDDAAAVAAAAAGAPSPPPGARPLAGECVGAARALRLLHPEVLADGDLPRGDWTPGGSRPARCALHTLVGTILSQSTTDVQSGRALAALRAALPTWAAVRDADPAVVEDLLRPAGLAATKAARIRAILSALSATGRTVGGRVGGEPSLDHLRGASPEAARAELLAFKGVGPKTAACVALFALDTPASPAGRRWGDRKSVV